MNFLTNYLAKSEIESSVEETGGENFRSDYSVFSTAAFLLYCKWCEAQFRLCILSSII